MAWPCYLWLPALPGSLLVLKTFRIFALALLPAHSAFPSDICMVGSFPSNLLSKAILVSWDRHNKVPHTGWTSQ